MRWRSPPKMTKLLNRTTAAWPSRDVGFLSKNIRAFSGFFAVEQSTLIWPFDERPENGLLSVPELEEPRFTMLAILPLLLLL